MEARLEVNTKCIHCDVCRLICPEDSISVVEEQYLIENWSCTLCGLCEQLCPTNAIDLITSDQ